MRIILSPTKKMTIDTDTIDVNGSVPFESKTKELINYLKTLSYDEAKTLWDCNDKIARENYDRIQNMDINCNLTPAILSYDGIAFKYMAPTVFEYSQFEYVQKHLRILSGLYGVLNAVDGVVPYRLEMQAKINYNGFTNLYDFWKDSIYKYIQDDNDDRIIINLASKEYSRCVEKYLKKDDFYLTCIFGELIKGKIVQKGVYAKMARGEMVRYLAENKIEDVSLVKDFDRLGFSFRADLSNENTFVFIK